MESSMILVTEPSPDYELLDSGEGEKLERYGKVVVRRPDPQALWPRHLTEKEWERADAHFTASWEMGGKIPERWPINLAGLQLYVKPTTFKHVGVFPEQASNWEWIRQTISSAERPVKVLNLFGYTGGASLAALQAGASVAHVDGSKVAVTWARDNAALSGLSERPARWLVDDAVTFLKREVRRGNTYDAIIMDPPTFGHGPNKELWKIEKHFVELLDLCNQVLSDTPLFVIINGYAAGYSAIAYENSLIAMMAEYQGVIEKGELALRESKSGRLLPAGIFARWRAV